MAAATVLKDSAIAEPLRMTCELCSLDVIVAVVPARPAGRVALIVTADPFEWEPRAACQSCAWTRARLGRSVDCARCAGTGYVGEKRPPGPLLAIDCAWSDEGHVRLLMPSTPRRKGEALYELHNCDRPAIVELPEHPDERQHYADRRRLRRAPDPAAR